MNEVIIIINGIRYDAVEDNKCLDCSDVCDLSDFCDEITLDPSTCYEMIGDKFFKKSDKKFER